MKEALELAKQYIEAELSNGFKPCNPEYLLKVINDALGEKPKTRYDWSKARPDTMWIATDRDGIAWQYSKRPHLKMTYWEAENLYDATKYPCLDLQNAIDWQDSLEQRPSRG